MKDAPVGYTARMSIIGLLVILLLFCLLVWCARALMAAFGIGDPIATVVWVVIVVIFVLWLVQGLGLLHGLPVLKLS